MNFLDFIQSPLTLGTFTLPVSLLTLLLELFLPLVAVVLFGSFLKGVIRRSLDKSTFSDKLKENLKTGLVWIIRIIQLSGILVLFLRLLGASINVLFMGFITILNTPFIASGDIRISVLTLLAIIPLLYLSNSLGSWAHRILDQQVFDKMGIDSKQRFSLSNLARYAVMVLVFIIGLSVIGISFTSLTALFAVFGVGIGFGLQSTVANFFSGLIIILTRPIKQGDFIKAVTADGSYEGTVIEIKLIYTVINTLLNETIIVPNSAIVDNSVHNYSYDDPSVIYPVPIQVHYNSDLDQVQEVLLGIGKDCPFQAKSQDPKTQIFSFDESGITVRLLLKLDRASDRVPSRNFVYQEIWRRFRDKAIQIPYPQMDVHIKSDPR